MRWISYRHLNLLFVNVSFSELSKCHLDNLIIISFSGTPYLLIHTLRNFLSHEEIDLIISTLMDGLFFALKASLLFIHL